MEAQVVAPHLLTVLGMLAVAIGGWIVHWKHTKYVLSEERKRLKIRIASETQARVESERLDRLRELVSELVTRIEPDDPVRPTPTEVVRLVNRIQLTLDLNHPGERQLNGTVNDLAMTLCGSGGQPVPRDEFLRLHARLINHGRQALRLPPMA